MTESSKASEETKPHESKKDEIERLKHEVKQAKEQSLRTLAEFDVPRSIPITLAITNLLA